MGPTFQTDRLILRPWRDQDGVPFAALNADAKDEEASKLREVAEHYRDRPKDKVFYAYADRLTYRTLNQK